MCQTIGKYHNVDKPRNRAKLGIQLRRYKLPTLYDPVYARFDNILHFYFEYVI